MIKSTMLLAVMTVGGLALRIGDWQWPSRRAEPHASTIKARADAATQVAYAALLKSPPAPKPNPEPNTGNAGKPAEVKPAAPAEVKPAEVKPQPAPQPVPQGANPKGQRAIVVVPATTAPHRQVIYPQNSAVYGPADSNSAHYGPQNYYRSAPVYSR
jgi:hypothetical protein